MLPNTPVLGQPDMDDIGNGMSFEDLMKGLRQCNADLHVPDPTSYPDWYPGKASGGTTLWWGQPHAPGSRKITALKKGMIPEFTVFNGDGIVTKGWRAILRKVHVSGAITKASIQRVFKVDLDYDGWNGYCERCQQDGEWVKTDNVSKLCGPHDQAQKDAAKHRDAQNEVKYQLKTKGLPPLSDAIKRRLKGRRNATTPA